MNNGNETNEPMNELYTYKIYTKITESYKFNILNAKTHDNTNQTQTNEATTSKQSQAQTTT